MGCKYWECKYNDLSQKGITDCGKPNELNIRHPCPSPNQVRDYCTEGELRDIDKLDK